MTNLLAMRADVERTNHEAFPRGDWPATLDTVNILCVAVITHHTC